MDKEFVKDNKEELIGAAVIIGAVVVSVLIGRSITRTIAAHDNEVAMKTVIGLQALYPETSILTKVLSDPRFMK